MIEIKLNEILVGSGDGSVCLVLDHSTKKLLQGKKLNPKDDGMPTQIHEPTVSCLQEVQKFKF